MSLIFIDSSYVKPALDAFSKLLSELVGPRGHKCLLISSGDLLTLTSTSCRVISNLSLENPILQFAVQCVQSQTERYRDGGLYCGIILSKLLAYLVDCPFPQHVACSILSELGIIAKSTLLNSENLRLKVTLDSIQPFIAVARSILLSKCGSFEGRDLGALAHVNTQISLLVRSFLESEACVGKVLICVSEKVSKQCLLNGVLYKCLDEEHVVLKNKPWESVSILLFKVMLTDKIDCNEKEIPGVEYCEKSQVQLEAAQTFINEALLCGIHVVACQKVVHPSIILNLRRNGILVLQRLGKRTADAVEMLSGAVPISSLTKSELASLPGLKGHLSRVQYIEDCGDHCVLLEGAKNSGICSLLLTSRLLESSAELEVVARQVLSALSQVIQDTAVCPGGGCTEVYLCCFLWNEVRKRKRELCEKLRCSTFQLDSVVQSLQKGLLLASGLNCQPGQLAVDSVHHHAWRGSDKKNAIVDVANCNCGLVTLSSVNHLKGSWTLLTPDHTSELLSNIHEEPRSPALSSTRTGNSIVLDVCSTKLSAFSLALENSIAIANIGAVISS